MKKRFLLTVALCAGMLLGDFPYECMAAETKLNTSGDYLILDVDEDAPAYKAGVWAGMPVEEDTASEVETELPASYQTNLLSLIEKYPSTRDQGDYQTCWAFASVAMAEFDLITDGLCDRTVDFSELQLAYFTYHSVGDPLGGTDGDSNCYKRSNYLNVGGNLMFTARSLSSWIGVAQESVADYAFADATRKTALDASLSRRDEAHLENAYIIDIHENPSAVKQEILRHGSVGISYYASRTGYYQDVVSPYASAEQVCTFYNPHSDTANHAVTIVGWDDSFSKDNFYVRPETDGAWLVRNSWSTITGNSKDSYFWMSYCDKSISDTAWVFDFESADKYDNNYQYDGGIYSASTTVSKAANIFFTADKKGVAEELSAVCISVSSASSVDYKIEIYTDLTDLNNPSSGKLQEAAITTGTTGYAGIYTIPLTKNVSLSAGAPFSVVVTLTKNKDSVTTNPAGRIGIDCEYGLEQAGIECKVAADRGQSFGGIAGLEGWFSVETMATVSGAGNFCIKALTKNRISEETDSAGETLIGGTTGEEAGDVSRPDSESTPQEEVSSEESPAGGDDQEETLAESTVDSDTQNPAASESETSDGAASGTDSSLDTSNSSKGAETSDVSTFGKDTSETAGEKSSSLTKTKIKSIKNKKSKKIILTFQKVKQAGGYQIAYSTSSKFKQSKKISISSAKKTSVTIQGLKKGKKYYVRVRAFKRVGAKTIYGPWSNKKSITIQK